MFQFTENMKFEICLCLRAGFIVLLGSFQGPFIVREGLHIGRTVRG